MVGIAGGMPRPQQKDCDIRLGDVLVSCVNGVPSVINYRLGKMTPNDFDIRSQLAEPPQAIQIAVSALVTQHQTAGATYLTHLYNMFKKNAWLNKPRVVDDYFIRPESRTDCTACATTKHLVKRGPRFLREPPDDLHDGTPVNFIDHLEDDLAN